MSLYHTILITSLFVLTFANRDSWHDPNDPTKGLRSAAASKSDNKGVVIRPGSADPTLRLILRQIMQELRIDYTEPAIVHRMAKIKISKHAMSTISKYLNEKVDDNAATREEVRSAMSHVFQLIEESSPPTWYDTLLSLQPYMTVLNVVLLPAAFFIVMSWLVRPRNFWILVVSTMIIVSTFATYNKKYQEAEARRFAKFQQARAQGGNMCAPEGVVSRVYDIIMSPFQYKQKSDCLQYIEAQTMSIFFEISLIEVFVETVIGGFSSMFSGTGKHIAVFFRDVYQGAPLVVQIVMSVFILVSMVRIRTPFITIEPLLLTFAASSIGQIVGWLQSADEPERRVAVKSRQPLEAIKARDGDGNEERKRIESKESIEKQTREKKDEVRRRSAPIRISEGEKSTVESEKPSSSSPIKAIECARSEDEEKVEDVNENENEDVVVVNEKTTLLGKKGREDEETDDEFDEDSEWVDPRHSLIEDKDDSDI